MAKKKYKEENIQAIADSIREKTGTEKTYKTKDMASGIGEVYEAGNEQGLIWAEDTFIHSKSDKNVVGRYYLFTSCDLSNYTFKKAFKPIGDCQTLFYDYRGKYLPKNMDLSEATSARQLYNWATELQEIPDYGLPAAPMVNGYDYCRKCHTIECIRITETLEPPRFYDCTNLVNLAFEGVIGKSISFSHSPLSPTSLKSVVKHLKNYSGIADHTQTLTVKASAWEALEAEGLNDEDKAWLISLMPYVEEDIDYVTWATVVDFFSWNLVLAS